MASNKKLIPYMTLEIFVSFIWTSKFIFHSFFDTLVLLPWTSIRNLTEQAPEG
jgi:hypothetical protein